MVTFQISGSNSSVNSTVYAVCSSIQGGQTYSFNGQALSLTSYLTVGGATYYGVTCGDVSTCVPNQVSVYFLIHFKLEN